VQCKLPLLVVKCLQLVKPVSEVAVRRDVVQRRGRLEQLDLRQDLELATSLVEVDETAVGRVTESCVNHHQVGQKRPEIRHSALDHRPARLDHPQRSVSRYVDNN